MKKNLKTINVNNETFNRIKKNKPTIYVEEKNELLEKLRKNDKIILNTSETNKHLIRKIKKIYRADSFNDLSNILGKHINKVSPSNIQGENLIVIEFKTKKRIITKCLLLLLMVVIVILLYFNISTLIMKHNNDKLQKNIKDVSTELSYVIIEINPKAILEIKDGKVSNMGCLNEDCLIVFKDTNLKNNTLKEAVEKLYTKAKEKNINVSNGVSISSNKEIAEEVKKLDYVLYKKVDKQQIKDEIQNVIDNKEIKEEKNKNEISNDILAVYKKDKDYGDLYECSIVDSEPVCYITEAFAKRLSTKNETIEEIMNSINEMRELENILDKFEFDYEQGGIEGLSQMIVNRIVANSTSYPLFGGFTYVTDTISATPNGIQDKDNGTFSEYYRFGLTIYNSNWEEELSSDFKIIVLPIEKIELISKTYKEADKIIITAENGYLKISTNS